MVADKKREKPIRHRWIDFSQRKNRLI